MNTLTCGVQSFPISIPKKSSAIRIAQQFQGSKSRQIPGGLEINPPDVMGAVSDRYVVSVTNQGYIVFDRNGKKLQDEISLTEFFKQFNPGKPSYPIMVDPRILYDFESDRWVMSAMAEDKVVGMAVSKSNNPMGEWYGYVIDDHPIPGEITFDYDVLGMNSLWYVVGLNILDSTQYPDRLYYVWLFVFNRQHALQGQKTMTVITVNNTYTLVPMVDRYATQDTMYLCAAANNQLINSSNSIFMYKLSGTASNPVLSENIITLSTDIRETWQTYSKPSGIGPQPNGAPSVEGSDNRILSVIYWRDHLFVSHMVYFPYSEQDTTDTLYNAVQIWKIDLKNMQLKNIIRMEDSSGKNIILFPALDINIFGIMCVAYNICNVNEFITIQCALIPVNTMEVMYAGVLKKSNATINQERFGTNRWGDYAIVQIDPVDNVSFWVHHEYVPVENNWGTWWSHLKPKFEPSQTIQYANGFPPSDKSFSSLMVGTVTSNNLISIGPPLAPLSQVTGRPNNDLHASMIGCNQISGLSLLAGIPPQLFSRSSLTGSPPKDASLSNVTTHFIL
jgi:hypothetical protein